MFFASLQQSTMESPPDQQADHQNAIRSSEARSCIPQGNDFADIFNAKCRDSFFRYIDFTEALLFESDRESF